jgi:hypothetical protein
MAGDVAQRKGSAKAIAAFFDSEEHRDMCEPLLAALFDDPAPEVRQTALGVFRDREGKAIGHMRGLVRAAVRTSAGAEAVVWAIEHTSTPVLDLAEEILEVGELFSTSLAEQASSIQHSLFAEGRSISKLLLRLYEQAEGDSNSRLRGRCLDAIDALLRARVGDVSEAIVKMGD